MGLCHQEELFYECECVWVYLNVTGTILFATRPTVVNLSCDAVVFSTFLLQTFLVFATRSSRKR